MITGLGQIAITVRNVEQSLRFYRDVLGLEFLFSPSAGLAFLAAGPVRIMLTAPAGDGTPGQNSVMYFRVPDCATAYADTVGRGATAEHEPQLVARLADHELLMAFIRDPDGNLIGLMEERR